MDRLIPVAYEFLRPRWIPLSLITLIAYLVGTSVTSAGWVDDSGSLVISLVLGLVFGAALTGSRFHRWAAAGYSLFVSSAIILAQVGRLVPSILELQQSSFPDMFWMMHLRFVTVSDRISGWAQALVGGETIRDTGLFVLLVGLLLWNAGSWLVWSTTRRHNALAGLLPVGLLLAVNVQLRRQNLEAFVFFLFCAVLLMAYTSFVGHHSDWEKRHVDYPEGLSENWTLGAFVIAVVVAVLARSAPVFGTPGGWQALSDLVRPVQEQAVDTSARLFTGVNPPDEIPIGVHTSVPDLAHIGSPPPQGDETIMWVSTDDQPPSLPGATPQVEPSPQHYWASVTLARYNGRGWEPTDTSHTNAASIRPAGASAGLYLLKQHFELVVPHEDTLFAASRPVTVSAGVLLSYDSARDIVALRGGPSNYQVISWVPHVPALDLVRVAGSYPEPIRSNYLQLPSSLPSRVSALAAHITSGASSEYEKAIRIQDYLRKTLPYKLDVPAPPSDRDVVDYFLFEAPGGFCTYYASAMAVMLRTLGIPARVVGGYAMGQFDFHRSAYRVTAAAAHVWVEVYFPGYGWIEFEPTPSQPTFDLPTKPGLPRAVDNSTDSISNGPGEMNWGMLGLVLLCVLVGAAAWLARMVEWRASTPQRSAQLSYWRMRRALACVGLTAPASATPDEFIAAHRGTLRVHRRLLSALTRSTALYLRATYSPLLPDRGQTNEARRLWWNASRDWFALALRLVLSRVGLLRVLFTRAND